MRTPGLRAVHILRDMLHLQQDALPVPLLHPTAKSLHYLVGMPPPVNT